jgi:hypothetical protein
MASVETIIEDKCHAMPGPLWIRAENAARLVHSAREAASLNSMYVADSSVAVSSLFVREMLR